MAAVVACLAAGGPNDYKKTVQRRVAPVSVETRIPGRTLVDFGKMAFGFFELVPPPGAPGRLVCARQPVELFCRGIYTKPKNVRVVRHPAHPAILHSVWRAKDGRVAAVLCNWTRKEQAYDLAAPDIAAAGVLPARSWRIVVK